MPSAKQRWLILFSALVVIAFQVGLFYAMKRFQTRKPDFAGLYQGGRKLDHERFPDLFTRFQSLNSDAHRVFWPDGTEYPSDTLHPPYEMLIYATLALFKYQSAYVLWWGCNLAILFWTAAALWLRIPRLQGSYPYLLILVATFFPVLLALVQGQNSVMVLAVFALCYVSLEKSHEFRAGFALGMGMFKFVLVLPMVLWLILEKRWRSLAGFLSGCSVLFLIALWLVGMSGIVDYVRLLAGFGKKAPELPGTEGIMPNLRGLVHAAGSSLLPESWLTILTLLASVLLLVWVDSRLSRYQGLSLRFSVQVLLTTLISYHLYPHDCAILVLPILLLLDRARREETPGAFKWAVFVCAACAYLSPFVAGLYIGMPIIGVATIVLLVVARNAALKPSVLTAAHASC